MMQNTSKTGQHSPVTDNRIQNARDVNADPISAFTDQMAANLSRMAVDDTYRQAVAQRIS